MRNKCQIFQIIELQVAVGRLRNWASLSFSKKRGMVLPWRWAWLRLMASIMEKVPFDRIRRCDYSE